MNNISFVILFIFSVFIASLSQILLKISANKKHEKLLYEYKNKYVIIAYGIFFISTILTMIAYRGVSLSYGPIIETTGYIFIAVLGLTILKEKISIRQTVGYLIIIVGIVVTVIK